MEKSKITVEQIKNKISDSYKEKGMTKDEFVDALLTHSRKLTMKKTSVLAALSKSGAISFNILSEAYEFLGLGNLSQETEVVHSKITKYYVEK